MILTRCGYYNEMPHGEQTDPSIKKNIGGKVDNKKEVCKYLRNGMVLAACGEVVKDVLHPEKGIIGTPDDMTDGTWLWPADLAYYVEEYDLQLDERFLIHMSNNNWTVPNSIEIDFDNLEVH